MGFLVTPLCMLELCLQLAAGAPALPPAPALGSWQSLKAAPHTTRLAGTLHLTKNILTQLDRAISSEMDVVALHILVDHVV